MSTGISIIVYIDGGIELVRNRTKKEHDERAIEAKLNDDLFSDAWTENVEHPLEMETFH